MIHILKLEKEARTKFWEVSSIKNLNLKTCVEDSLSQNKAFTEVESVSLRVFREKRVKVLCMMCWPSCVK
jgi:hypothetical protein